MIMIEVPAQGCQGSLRKPARNWVTGRVFHREALTPCPDVTTEPPSSLMHTLVAAMSLGRSGTNAALRIVNEVMAGYGSPP